MTEFRQEQNIQLKIGLWLILIVFLLITITGSFFTVNPNDRANVRRFGRPLYSRPLGSGLYFKLPFADSVDRIQVALTTQEINQIDVGTIDNQRVKMHINFNYRIPDSEVNRVLYEIGGVGNKGIEDQVEKTVESVAVDVIATQNMNSLNSSLETVRSTMEKQCFEQLKRLYGIEGERLQIKSITPSEAFMRSNEAAVNAKNAAVAAENQLKTVQFQAQQAVAKAKGDADAFIAEAQGKKQAAILESEGFRAQIAVFGSASAYNDYLRAKSAANWKGDVPQVVGGSDSGPSIVIPFGQAPGAGAK